MSKNHFPFSVVFWNTFLIIPDLSITSFHPRLPLTVYLAHNYLLGLLEVRPSKYCFIMSTCDDTLLFAIIYEILAQSRDDSLGVERNVMSFQPELRSLRAVNVTIKRWIIPGRKNICHEEHYFYCLNDRTPVANSTSLLQC